MKAILFGGPVDGRTIDAVPEETENVKIPGPGLDERNRVYARYDRLPVRDGGGRPAVSAVRFSPPCTMQTGGPMTATRPSRHKRQALIERGPPAPQATRGAGGPFSELEVS